MRSRTVIVILALATAMGCYGIPKVQPTVVGLGDLPSQRESGAEESYAAAATLPRLGEACPDADLQWCQGGRERAEYLIGPGDRLTVTVWGREDLGSQSTTEGVEPASVVTPDGTLVLPFLAEVPVEGMSLRQIASRVAERYGALVSSPQVEVRMQGCASRTVEIQGAVARGGTYALCTNRLTLGAMLQAAGGLASDADASRAILARHEVPFRLDYRASMEGEAPAADILLEEGDSIYFPSSDERVFYAFGEVDEQGVHPIPDEGITLLGAIGTVGGYEVISARTQRFFLIRPQGSSTEIYQLDLGVVMASADIQVFDGDRIFFPPSSLTRWNRWFRQIFPFNIGNQVVGTN